MLKNLATSKEIMQIISNDHENVYWTVLSDYWLIWIPKIKAPSKKKSKPSATFARALIEILSNYLILLCWRFALISEIIHVEVGQCNTTKQHWNNSRKCSPLT